MRAGGDANPAFIKLASIRIWLRHELAETAGLREGRD